MTFRQLRIGQQLAFSFGLIGLLLAALMVLAYGRIEGLNAGIALTSGELYPKTVLAQRIKDKVNEAVISMRSALLVADPAKAAAELESIETGARVIVASIDAIGKLSNDADKQYLGGLTAARQKFVAARTHFADLVKAGDKVQAQAMLFSEVQPAQQAYFDALDGMIATQQQRMEDNVKRSAASARQTQYLIVGFSLLALLLGALVAWVVGRSVAAPMAGAVAIARRVADGDLSGRIEVEGRGRNESAQMLLALRDMNHSLTGIVARVRAGTTAIAGASAQIAAGNADLSARTEQQAGALAETAQAMGALTETVRRNAGNAGQADTLAGAAAREAEEGGAMVREVVTTMHSIGESSRRIVDITAVIDGIAFQTNILALNAAVEAARAGEQGRGFAVVASEVRSLAQRSAAAAKEIKVLIDDSSARVDAGAALVQRAGQTMDGMVGSVRRVSAIVAEISAAGIEQSGRIEEINQVMGRMEEGTRQNAVLVEEAAAAAASMQQQAEALAGMVDVFRLGAEHDAATPSATLRRAPVTVAPARLRQA